MSIEPLRVGNTHFRWRNVNICKRLPKRIFSYWPNVGGVVKKESVVPNCTFLFLPSVKCRTRLSIKGQTVWSQRANSKVPFPPTKPSSFCTAAGATCMNRFPLRRGVHPNQRRVWTSSGSSCAALGNKRHAAMQNCAAPRANLRFLWTWATTFACSAVSVLVFDKWTEEMPTSRGERTFH